MVLERTANEVIIRLPASINWEDLELMIRFIKYKQNVSNSKATQEEIDQLARDVNKQWWEENKHRFLKQSWESLLTPTLFLVLCSIRPLR
jgi:hypothetical protein